MQRRFRSYWFGLIPVVFTLSAVLALGALEPGANAAGLARALDGPAASDLAAPQAQGDVAASECVTELLKWVDPEKLNLGETTDVSLVVSGTCPGTLLPVDIVILADESNSMTPARGGDVTEPTEPRPTRPTPGETPRPTRPPPPEPGETPPGGGGGGDTPGGGEPPFCNPQRPGGDAPGPEPTEPGRPTRPPPGETIEPPGPPDPPPGPGPGPIEPTPPSDPTPNIEDLEPSGDRDELREVQKWVADLMRQREIVDHMESGRLQMGFVSFSERPRIRQSLTDNPGKISGGAGRMRSGEITKIDLALREADRILFGAGYRKPGEEEQRLRVVVILSDFQFCQRDMRVPGRLRKDAIIVTMGFGVRNYDRQKVKDLASEQEYAFERANVGQFMDIYRKDLAVGNPVDFETLVVRDDLKDNMQLVPGSVDPPTVTITGQLIEWQFMMPTLPLTLGYEIEPQEAGLHPVSVMAEAIYSDTIGLPGRGLFPDVDVEVVPPTPTPTSTNTPTATATATNTPTATPTPGPVFLPITYKNWPEPTPTPEVTECIPEEQTVDVALVIDTSTSMSQGTSEGGQPKLEAAIEAGAELVRLLKEDDQAAIVGFNRTAHLATRLTSDKDAITAALQSLPGTQAMGTSINLGLQMAFDELKSPRHKYGNHRSIVLVTDGQQTGEGGNAAVIEVARQIRATNIKLITVGLGRDVDEQLLRSIATGPELYFPAPDAEELKAIYREIAQLIPCP